jgi:hypothetical protein
MWHNLRQCRKSRELDWQRSLVQFGCRTIIKRQPVDSGIKTEGRFQRKDREVVYLGKPIDQVTNLVIERVPGGAVIRATGLTTVQGVSLVQLTPSTEDGTPINGVLTYRLEGVRPVFNESVGSTHTRTVVAARALTDQELAGVRSIRVKGAHNAQTSRHR